MLTDAVNVDKPAVGQRRSARRSRRGPLRCLRRRGAGDLQRAFKQEPRPPLGGGRERALRQQLSEICQRLATSRLELIDRGKSGHCSGPLEETKAARVVGRRLRGLDLIFTIYWRWIHTSTKS